MKNTKTEVTYWFTFNEVWAVATNQHIEGTFPPWRKHTIMTKAVQISKHSMMVAHAKAACAV
ncbi:MAG: family 1 glycosylhydrolase [Holdemanella porci]